MTSVDLARQGQILGVGAAGLCRAARKLRRRAAPGMHQAAGVPHAITAGGLKRFYFQGLLIRMRRIRLEGAVRGLHDDGIGASKP